MNKNIAVEIASIQSQIQDAVSIGEKRFLRGQLNTLHTIEKYMARYEETVELRTQYLRGVHQTLNDFFKDEENGQV